MAIVELKITVGDDGQIAVTGPINQRGLCYQLLELARDAIKEHNDQLQKSPIHLVGANGLDGLQRMPLKAE